MPNPVTGPPGSSIQQAAAASGVQLPNIPIAIDLPSALVAINAIGQAIQILANAIPNSAGNQSTGAASVTSSFEQTNQTVRTVILTDPNDATVQVEIEQITSLTLVNPTTKEVWQWNQAG